MTILFAVKLELELLGSAGIYLASKGAIIHGES
jgi:hypothetical protein